MATRIPRSEFATTYDLPDWRILHLALEASVRAPSFAEATAFLAEVVQEADAVDHHPDLDLRYPGRVLVRLTSHDAGGLTERDAQLATIISARAAARGLTSAPLEGQRVEVAIDAVDIGAVLPFWRAVLAYEDGTPWKEGEPVNDLYDPRGVGPAFWFQQMDEPRLQRNRIHLDVIVPHDEVDDRIAAALAAGGTLLTDRWARAFWVLADPEGNEACLCTWQDRE